MVPIRLLYPFNGFDRGTEVSFAPGLAEELVNQRRAEFVRPAVSVPTPAATAPTPEAPAGKPKPKK